MFLTRGTSDEASDEERREGIARRLVLSCGVYARLPRVA